MFLSEIVKPLLYKYPRFLLNFVGNQLKYKGKDFYQSDMAMAINATVEHKVKLYPYAKVISSHVGAHTYIGCQTTVKNATIGRFCSIGPKCSLGLGMHPVENVSTSPAFYSMHDSVHGSFSDSNYFDDEFKPVTVGNDVWIGDGALVMGGVSIGDGAVIAARSVVTKDVPSYAIYGGVPAKLIRYRFSQEVIQKLLSIKWWDKDESWLKENFKNFHDVDEFVAKFSIAQKNNFIAGF